MDETSWLVVPCPASRYFELLACLGSFAHPLERTVVVTAAPDAIPPSLVPAGIHYVHDTFGQISFSRWYNWAADRIDSIRPDGPFEIFYTGSDSFGTPDSIPRLRDAMRSGDFTCVGPLLHGDMDAETVVVRRHGEHRHSYNRVPGCSMMMRGELGLRMDEQMRWWYSDDDLETQACALGPVAQVGGTGVRHPQDHALTADQAVWAAESRALYAAKWGHEPW